MALNQQGEEEKPKPKAEHDYVRIFFIILSVVFVIALAVVYVYYDLMPGLEFLVFVVLIYAAYNKKTWKFVKDWVPFVLVFASYESMNDLVGATAALHLHDGPYNLDNILFFGNNLTLIFQHYLGSPVLDYFGAFFYTIYLFVPTVFAFFVWRKDYEVYKSYVIAFGVLVYSALLTFLVYPVAPPWLNPALTDQGLVHLLTASVDKSIGFPVYTTLYGYFGSNAYAAFPSLHSAIPWLVFLFAYKIWGKKALPLVIIPVGTWFSAIYLGEHYLTDVLGGILYATLAYLFVVKLLPFLSKRFSPPPKLQHFLNRLNS